MRRPSKFLLLLSAAALAIPSCSAPAAPAVARPGEQIELCPVCAWRGDLACMDVVVDDQTPKADFDGRTWWFCSEECRERFVKDPARFAR